MNTNHTNSSARRITAAALMVAAAGALAVGGLGAAATANAKPGIINPAPPAPAPPQSRAPETAPRYAAIALSSDGVWATYSSAVSNQGANTGALSACENAGGINCVLTGTATNECIALAVDAVDFEHWSPGYGSTKMQSMTAALESNGGGRIAATACTPAGPPMAFTGRVNQMRY